jgi:hypothetical protein
MFFLFDTNLRFIFGNYQCSDPQVKYGVRSPKFILGSMCTALLIGWDPATALPPIPPHLGSYTRALLVSQDRQYLFMTPCTDLINFWTSLTLVSWGRILEQNPVPTVPSTALPWDFYFFKLTQPLTVSVKEKVGKHDRKPHPIPFGLRNSYKNLKSENSQDYICPEPQRRS